MADERGAAVTIEIRIACATVFLFTMPGCTPVNADWARRKRNTVELLHRSSYGVGCELRRDATSLEERLGLSTRDYASHGGSFPLTLGGVGCIGKKYKTWFHIDGAYGGLAASLSSLEKHYVGLEKADSIALDFHKWLYQPFEIGCILVRNWQVLRETYFKQADYLDTQFEQKTARLEFNEHYFQLSRNGKAFKV